MSELLIIGIDIMVRIFGFQFKTAIQFGLLTVMRNVILIQTKHTSFSHKTEESTMMSLRPLLLLLLLPCTLALQQTRRAFFDSAAAAVVALGSTQAASAAGTAALQQL